MRSAWRWYSSWWAFSTIGVWAAFGQGMRGFLSNPRRLRMFNVTMAILLVASLYPLFARLLAA